ncbi:hypothetical protein GGR56DRAFT_695666 [Xylariaceae sp. FL0804]|nr:hypothetical protein GGR56DRAFT_695666 [Xylariaceae sp. FL0804]
MTSRAAVSEAASQPPPPDVSRVDRHGYLFGQHLAASLSPEFHNAIYDGLGLRWAQLRLDSADIPAFLRLIQDPRCFGASVTMPNKVAIMAYLDEATDECVAVGACNTIFFRPGHGHDGRRLVCGANTDVAGVREALIRNLSGFGFGSPAAAPAAPAGADAKLDAKLDALRGRPALVVGGGGAARSAVYALRRYVVGPTAPVYVASRDAGEVAALQDLVVVVPTSSCPSSSSAPSSSAPDSSSGRHLVQHVATAAQAARLPPPAVVVSCVPDLAPATAAEAAARDVVLAFLGEGEGAVAGAEAEEGEGGRGGGRGGGSGRRKEKGVLLEMCYNPRPHTALAAVARRAGWRVVLGTEAMMWQGLEQDKYWTGRAVEDLPIGRGKEVIAARLAPNPRL